MKTVSVGLAAELESEFMTVTSCVKLVLMKYQPRITNITNGNPGIVTTRWAHGLITGDVVKLRMVRGMTEVNRQEYQIIKLDDYSYSIDANTSAFGVYTKKGISHKVIGFTSFVNDLIFEKVNYRATLGYTPESIKQGSDMALDSIEHRGILQNKAKNEIAGLLADGINDEDLASGRYDGAEFEVFLINYEDLAQGRMAFPISGSLGKTSLHRGTYQAEMLGKTARLQEQWQKVYTKHCRADLGDDYDGSEPEHKDYPGFGCKLDLQALGFIHEGTVTGVIDRRRFMDASRSEPPIEGIGGVSTLFPIIAVNVGAKRFTIEGNHAAEFPASNRFTVVNSPANDGTYTIASSTDSGANTLIVVTTTPDAGVGGSIVGRLPTLVGYFTYGLVTFLDGKNIGIAREVKSFSVSTTDGITFTGPGLFELFEAFPFDIELGDSYEAQAGCDKSLVACTTKFNNINNRRAEDNIRGQDDMLLYPDAK